MPSDRDARLLQPRQGFDIGPLTEREAEELIRWRYPGAYSFYDMERDPEDLAELRAGHVRAARYLGVRHSGELIGFFEFDVEGEVVEFGLGLRPDLTGRGLGAAFLSAGLAYLRNRFHPQAFRLRVAIFNQRAIKLYERAGFERGRTYTHDFYGTPYGFMEMIRPA